MKDDISQSKKKSINYKQLNKMLLKRGDEKSIDVLVRLNKGRVEYIARNFYHTHFKVYPVHDLIQQAFLAFMRCIDTFSTEKGNSFHTYYSKVITHELLNYWLKGSFITSACDKINIFVYKMLCDGVKKLTVKEIAEKYDIGIRKSRHMHHRMSHNGAGFEFELYEKSNLLDDKNRLNNSNGKNEDIKILIKSISKLSKLEKEVIKHRYLDGESLEKTGKKMKVCAMTILNWQNKILEKLRSDFD